MGRGPSPTVVSLKWQKLSQKLRNKCCCCYCRYLCFVTLGSSVQPRKPRLVSRKGRLPRSGRRGGPGGRGPLLLLCLTNHATTSNTTSKSSIILRRLNFGIKFYCAQIWDAMLTVRSSRHLWNPVYLASWFCTLIYGGGYRIKIRRTTFYHIIV